ncbi:MAG: CAP domain-containing protein, partial [Patescibacteria group bacterium]
MKRLLKKYFIPHPENDHQPHFLRHKTTRILAGALVVAELLFILQIAVIIPNSGLFALILPNVLVDETNQSRSGGQLSFLKPNPLLEQAAALKAQDMAVKGYFAHNAPDGKTPWYWFNQVGYSFLAAGENLAVNFNDSKDVVNAWMRSSAHRANVLNNNFTEIGIGVAEGQYQGRTSFFVVQLFGRPAPKKSANQLALLPQNPALLVSEQIDTTNAEGSFIAVKGVEII